MEHSQGLSPVELILFKYSRCIHAQFVCSRWPWVWGRLLPAGGPHIQPTARPLPATFALPSSVTLRRLLASGMPVHGVTSRQVHCCSHQLTIMGAACHSAEGAARAVGDAFRGRSICNAACLVRKREGVSSAASGHGCARGAQCMPGGLRGGHHQRVNWSPAQRQLPRKGAPAPPFPGNRQHHGHENGTMRFLCAWPASHHRPALPAQLLAGRGTLEGSGRGAIC